ncbi:MAG TPA: DUF4397 domain-containing protein [Gemmatimonadaceae bacterium]|nr:DUF4397 domain-containing protein [Gemmatimonadaceae bacterium]
MRLKVILALGLTALGLSACKDDSGITDPRAIPPQALIRFVNATVDTGIVDFRFIDKVENLPTFLGVKFRGTSGGYQRVDPGTRPVRVFVNSTNPTEAQKRLIDTTITLAADTRYTLVYMGQARGNADRLVVLQDPFTFPTPPAGKIAIRALNADPSVTPADVYIARSDTTDPVAKSAAKITSVALQSYSAYVNVDTASASTLYKFAVTPTGGTTPSYTSSPNVPGATAPAGASYGPSPGVRIAGSVLTALLTAAPTAGSPAATAANQATSTRVVVLVDKILNP